jgi:murein DD-endopeptidase MepM/ murein hydrolase activator NlpD
MFSGELSGYGLTIIIDNYSGYSTVYAHNSYNIVKNGQKVKQGEIIGYTGKTGRATCPHLHFEIRKDTIPQNPLDFLFE